MRLAATFPLCWQSWKRSARTGGGRCRRTRVTIALADCAAMRKLAPDRVVPQPAALRPLGQDLGPDLGTGAVKVMGSDLGAGAVKGRAGAKGIGMLAVPGIAHWSRHTSMQPSREQAPDAASGFGPTDGCRSTRLTLSGPSNSTEHTAPDANAKLASSKLASPLLEFNDEPYCFVRPSIAHRTSRGGQKGEVSLKIFTHAATALLVCLGLAAVPTNGTQAAELQVLAGAGIRVPLNEIAAQFERVTGHKAVIRYGTAPELIKMATSGGPFDLGVVPADVFKDEATRAQFTSESMPEVARIGIGVAVPAGARKPDVSTPEALKQTLLKSRSIASIPASATGAYLATVYERLGIAEEVKARMKAQPDPQQIAVAVGQRRGRAGCVHPQCTYGSAFGRCWSTARRAAKGDRLQGRCRRRRPRCDGGQGVHCLPDVP